MNTFVKLLFLPLAAAMVLAVSAARAGDEKVPIDKLPKPVVDAVKAQFPKGTLKRAVKSTEDKKTVYEVVVNLEKGHLHAFVTAEGKLYEIHKHVDGKDVPDKVAKAVQGKYPKGKWENVEEMSTPDGKVIGYEIAVELDGGSVVELVVAPDGKITRETKLDPKKTGK